ncbi:MAG: hypothetical protein LBH19_13965 [Dysgonamonadaceae bacterium]|jgi:hypothetical protein|nr:hypothetical protein [Dysgonamonadaceae bacterium]
MQALSEFLPLIFIVIFVVISVRKGINQKRQEEMAKTVLPGRRSGQEIPVPEMIPAAPVQVQSAPSRKATSKPLRQSDIHSRSAHLSEKESVEEIAEPVLNIEDRDDIKKAIIYTEIFNRKEY